MLRPGLFRLLTLLAAALLLPRPAPACVMREEVPSSAYEAFSEQFHGQALWMNYTLSSGHQAFCSAFRLNDMWAVTAAHCVQAYHVPVTAITVGTSPNRNTPELGEVRQIVRFIVHPGFNGWPGATAVGGNSVDLALLQFDRPLPGPVVRIVSLPVGDSIRSVGYGVPARPSGYLPGDGKRRAYEMRRSRTHSSWPSFYMVWFQPTYYVPFPYEGGAAGGDSGSGVFNLQGELVGVMASGSPPGDQVSAGFLRLDLYQAWVETMLTPQLTITSLAGAHRLSWDGAATGWELQSSPNLRDWTPLLPALSGAGNHDDPTAGHPHRFYRLIKP